jgi:formylmethanofuran dehydrogenase subunit E
MHVKSASPDITICGHPYEKYVEMVRAFHGHIAPGMILGGFMVDLAFRNRPQADLFDAICETRHCLPDAVQLLTPCTVGNGWLRIVDTGRFALSLYAKYTGEGVRVHVDNAKLDAWPAIRTFLFKLKPKKEQDHQALIAEIRMANSAILAVEHVAVDLESGETGRRAAMSVCPGCGEGYPKRDGDVCLSCQGRAPYLPCAKQDPHLSVITSPDKK